jgi:hypothetical protein
LQVYYELQRAAAKSDYRLPAMLRAEIPRHLIQLAERPLDFPATTGYFYVYHWTHLNVLVSENPATECLWLPWAIACAIEWLGSPDAAEAPPEVRVRVRRSLGHLVVDLGAELLPRIGGERPDGEPKVPIFEAAELLYCLSLIPLPEAPSSRK